jgi:hypothetical protein
MDRQHFKCNGINAETGEYLIALPGLAEMAMVARGNSRDEVNRDLRLRMDAGDPDYALRDDYDPDELADAGWGIVFCANATPSVREALQPLIEHRRAAASRKRENRFRIFEGAHGYRSGLTKEAFFTENKASPGRVDPDRLPYYLLLVGSPSEIPFSFQYRLDIAHAVGRLDLERPEQYASYAKSVVAAECGTRPARRRAAFWAPRNPDDEATELSADVLIAGLREYTSPRLENAMLDFHVGDEAGKERLLALIGGAERPDVLFTASHGVAFPPQSDLQSRWQGALLTQDWPGPIAQRGALPPSQYFGADDLDSGADVAGLIHFCFACYGAGTPATDEFSEAGDGETRQIAPFPFVSPLARAMLGHPRGGALAFIGHVERAWGYSFYWPEAGAATKTFEDALGRVLAGHRVGYAMEPINERHAELGSSLNEIREAIRRDGLVVDDAELVQLWTANNDARNYAVIGDPAVRIEPLTRAQAHV